MQEQNLGQKSCKTQWSKTGHKLRTGKNLPDLGCIFFKHSCHRSFKRDLITESKWPWKDISEPQEVTGTQAEASISEQGNSHWSSIQK